MYTLRRWWDRHGLQVALVGLAVGAAWAIRYTQASMVVEVFQEVTRPFQLTPTKEEQLERARVLARDQRLAELESQNRKFKELLGIASSKQKGVVAPVIGRSADHWWQQVTLGKGSKEGVKKGDIVTGPGGLVGRIESVSPNTSRVLLVTDSTSRVGITISRSRNMGFMRGQGTNQAVIEFFDKVPDVKPGDVITTSPISELFPAGIPVGRVESVNITKSPAPEAYVELSAPVNALEWVIVSASKSSLEEVNQDQQWQ
jgi:rod shape-determining protein MreC